MALDIRSREADALAPELARLTGETKTAAVTRAIRDRLGRVRRSQGGRVAILPVDASQAEAAREAFRQYGKGRHPAGLNVGDCFAYALARTRGEPLLFKGADFAMTDLRAALEPAPAG